MSTRLPPEIIERLLLEIAIVMAENPAYNSQKAIAKVFGRSTNIITNWKIGNSIPTLHQVYLFCKKFNRSADWIILGKKPSTEIEKQILKRLEAIEKKLK